MDHRKEIVQLLQAESQVEENRHHRNLKVLITILSLLNVLIVGMGLADVITYLQVLSIHLYRPMIPLVSHIIVPPMSLS